MRILLLGATGRTGRHVLKRLEARAHEVVTYGRRPGGGARAPTGPVGDATALRGALDGVEAVVSCLASTNAEPVCSTATGALIEAADRPLRYLLVSGASVAMEGEARGFSQRAGGAVMRLFMGGMIADREREMARLRASPLAWTALRPPRLSDRDGLGAWRFDADRPHAPVIARADLAGAIVEALGRDDLIRRAPYVSEDREAARA